MEVFLNNPYYLFTKDILTALATMSGLIIAGVGLATWKKQLKGTKEFEAAYYLHYSILKLRSAIKHVRNPAIWPSESYRAEQYLKLKYSNDLDESKKTTVSGVYEMRWEEITKAFTEMESHLLAVEVLWGTDIFNLIRPLNKKVTELNIALRQYFNQELRTKDYGEINNVVYDHGSEDEEDAFSKEVTKHITEIDLYLKSKIS